MQGPSFTFGGYMIRISATYEEIYTALYTLRHVDTHLPPPSQVTIYAGKDKFSQRRIEFLVSTRGEQEDRHFSSPRKQKIILSFRENTVGTE